MKYDIDELKKTKRIIQVLCKKWRVENDIRLEDIASIFGGTVSNMSKFENGESSSSKIFTAYVVASKGKIFEYFVKYNLEDMIKNYNKLIEGGLL